MPYGKGEGGRRLQRLSGRFLRVLFRCDDTFMNMVFPLTVKHPRVVYDVRQSLRGVPLEGELHITMDVIDFDMGILASRQKGQSRTLVSFVDIVKMERFQLTLHGMGVLGSLLNLVLHAMHRVYAKPQEELFRIVLWRALQRYADNNVLPV